MSAATNERAEPTQIPSGDSEVDRAIEERKKAERSVEFTPVGESQPIKLTVGMVKSFLAVKTRSGQEPDNADVVKFMMLCKTRGLNPFVGDAELVGYDNKDRGGNIIGKTFSLITTQQAYLKRAEMKEDYRGKRKGIVIEQDGELTEIEGAIVPSKAKLAGGWCEVIRRDREPERVSVALKAYDQGRSRWKDDPAGMIVKIAVCEAIRHAYPTTAGMEITTHLGVEEFEAAESQLIARNTETAKQLAKATENENAPSDEQTPEVAHESVRIFVDLPPDELPTADMIFAKFSEATSVDECNSIRIDISKELEGIDDLIALVDEAYDARKIEIRGGKDE